MTTIDSIKAWQCIGCGMIEAPQTCVGVCEHHRVEFVYASEHKAALAQATEAAHRLETLVRLLASTTPREGEWEKAYRAFQDRARRELAALASHV